MFAAKKPWVVVSQGDTKALPSQNAIMAVVEGQINYAAFACRTVTLPGKKAGRATTWAPGASLMG